MNAHPKYKRVLLKMSGEALKTGLDSQSTDLFSDEYVVRIAKVIKKCADAGVQFGVVVGGGNIWRGRSSGNMDRSVADHMGMLATAMNCLFLHDALRRIGVPSVVLTTVRMDTFGELFTKEAAIEYLNAGKVVLFAGGIGAPFFSTDTPSVLRAAEIEADMILFAKNVDGVYSADPRVDPNAKLIKKIS